MKLHNDFSKNYLSISSDFILTIGNFDGFHTGHQSIMHRINSKKYKTKVCISFIRKPATFFEHNFINTLIIPLEEKIKNFSDLGIDICFLLDFDKEVMDLAHTDFCDLLLQNNYFCGIIVGENFRFGKGRIGDIDFLKSHIQKYGKIVESVPLVYDEGKLISSSMIRNSIMSGDFSVNKYLLHPFFIQSVVEGGKKIGRSIGFPTANIYIYDQVMPREGTYFTITKIDNRFFYSMTYIGSKGQVETHIFDFNESIYNRSIQVIFISFIRNNYTISSIDELKQFLNNDKDIIFSKLCKDPDPYHYYTTMCEGSKQFFMEKISHD